MAWLSGQSNSLAAVHGGGGSPKKTSGNTRLSNSSAGLTRLRHGKGVNIGWLLENASGAVSKQDSGRNGSSHQYEEIEPRALNP